MEQVSEKLNEFGDVLSESAISVLPMLLPKPVEVKVGTISDWKAEAFPHPLVLITSEFKEGPEGSIYFIMPAEEASMMIDLMLGGEGATDRTLDDDSLDALKEIMNQLLGVVATSLRERYETAYGFDQVEVHSLEANMDLGLLLDDGNLHKIDLNIKIGDSDEQVLSCCLPAETMTALAESTDRSSAAAEPEADASPAKADEPAATAEKADTVAEEDAAAVGNVNLIMDIELPIIIRLGTAEMTLQEIIKLGPGAIVELNKSVDAPVELLVNDKMIAKGEVVVVEGNFAFRVTDVESKSKRIRSLA